MSKQLLATRSRGRSWMLAILIFAAGLVVGTLFGVYGMRYFFFRFPPHGDEMVARAVSRIDKDYSLDEEAEKRVEAEVRAFFLDIHESMDKNRRMVEERIGRTAEAIAAILPEGQRQRWRNESRNYFRKGPPPPPPPSPPSP